MSNKLSQKAGLAYNVNKFKKHLKAVLASQDYDNVKIKSSHVATAAATQIFQELMISRLSTFVKKDKSEMKTVTREIIKKTIRNAGNDDLYQFFNPVLMRKFDKTFVYTGSLCVSDKTFLAVVDKMNKSMTFTPKAKNYFYFMLQQVTNQLVSTAYLFPKFAKRKLFDANAIKYACEVLFASSISKVLKDEVNRAIEATGSEVTKDEENEEDVSSKEEEESEDDDSDDELETKSKKF